MVVVVVMMMVAVVIVVVIDGSGGGDGGANVEVMVVMVYHDLERSFTERILGQREHSHFPGPLRHQDST